MRTMVIALKAPIPFTFLFISFESLIFLSLSPKLQDSYDCKSKRERREIKTAPLLKNEIKRKKKASQLFNSHSLLSISLCSLKFSKIGIRQMKQVSIFFSVFWLSLSQSFTHSLFFFCFMQDPKTSPARKPWYQRAMAVARFATNWRTIPKTPPEIRPSRNPSVSKSNSHQQLRRCTSLKVAANSFTRVCLCAPIGPYDEVFRNYVPPRRSSSYPPSKPLPAVNETAMVAVAAARMSLDSGRRIFRGKSLKENALMSRFVAAEEEAMMENRRRDEMEIVRKRSQMRKKKRLGPSPLSRMVIAEDQQVFHQ